VIKIKKSPSSWVGPLFSFLAVVTFLVSHSQVKVLGHYPVHQVVFFRALGVLLFSLPYLLYMNISILGVNRKDLFLRGLFGSMALFLYFSSLQNIALTQAITLQQLAPIFALVVSHFLLKEKSSLRVYLLFIASFIGVYFIKGSVGGGGKSLSLQAVGENANTSWYFVFGIVAALFSALAYNFIRKLRKTDHPILVLSYFQYCLIPPALIGFCLYGYVLPNTKDIAPLLFLAVFSFLAQLFLTLAYQLSVVSMASSLNFLAIPLSVVVGYYFFEESLSLKQMFGALLVLVCILANLFLKKKNKK
jgi:drug/metabolite transporter (DMT)-like permease